MKYVPDCYRDVTYTVCKPVYETCMKTVNYTVCKPVYETVTKQICYTVCKPVWEQRRSRFAHGLQGRSGNQDQEHLLPP